ncbi:cation transporter [Paenibacillus sp. UMB7766-LJ446]|uniref:cation transporter n=1 Tax=Paenibacillus sp. UMB7766-LJ446 TaxID=3046313 RepID=UPI00254EBB0D|nr:cation transporter [Paenibacillus sp. UMB7766-LJ446]MDK8193169.1 cation transporter [Paenibacillus sp. UMB7766-LJ446]
MSIRSKGVLNSLGIQGDVNVNLDHGTVTVVYDDSKVSQKSIKEDIEEQGYEV